MSSRRLQETQRHEPIQWPRRNGLSESGLRAVYVWPRHRRANLVEEQC